LMTKTTEGWILEQTWSCGHLWKH